MERRMTDLLKTFIFLLGICMLLHVPAGMGTVCAEGVSLNKSKITLTKGSTYTLKLKNATGTAKWSSSDKKVATVNFKGKVKAKKKGTAVITAKLKGKKYKCTVKVKNPAAASKQEKDVAALVNKERKKRGLGTVTIDSKLQKAADKRAKEIEKYFSHTRPNGESCFTVLDDYNIQYGLVGENIAMGYSSPSQVMEGWMNSPGHRMNILNAGFRKIGVGYYKSSKSSYGYYWVQIFSD